MAKRVLFTEDPNLSEVEEISLQELAVKVSNAPALTPLTAYLLAREELGGESLRLARLGLERLDKYDKQAERALNDFEERIERSGRLGRIIPNNAITLRKLHEAHAQTRQAYNDAARRFEARLTALRTPEARAKIQKRATELIAEDRKQRLTFEQKVLHLKPQASEEKPNEKIAQNLNIKRITF